MQSLSVGPSSSAKSRFLIGVSAVLVVLSVIGIPESTNSSVSPDNPIEISDVHELQAMLENLTADYVLVNNIDASETVNWNEGKGFKPIGTGDYPFMGTFDGQRYEIKGLFINRPDEEYVGLFGNTHQGIEIRNVGIVDADVSGYRNVGVLVGWSNGTIGNCYATGSVSSVGECTGGLIGYNRVSTRDSYANVDVSGSTTVGGLVGYNGGEVDNCHASGSVAGRTWVGGLVGSSSDDGVSDSYASGDVSGNNGVGGLVGQNFASVVNSYATGSVTGDDEVGGLAGVNHWLSEISGSYARGDVLGSSKVGGLVGRNSGRLNDSYATGDVSGSESVGGLIGYSSEGATIVRAYAVGRVTGDVYAGGLLGWNMGDVQDSFWDIETSGMSESAGGIGKATAEMKSLETFANGGWSMAITDKSDPTDGYPFLSWQLEGSPTWYIFGEVPPSEPEERTLTITVVGEGTTIPAPGTHSYGEGEIVTIRAIPDGGWIINEWSGDVDTVGDVYAAETTITMDSDYDIVATFVVDRVAPPEPSSWLIIGGIGAAVVVGVLALLVLRRRKA